MVQDKKFQYDKKVQLEQKVELEKVQGKKKICVDLFYVDQGQVDKLVCFDVQVLIGLVKLCYDSMYMYCDSVLIYEKINFFEVFSNVCMEQGDIFFIYGDYLFYDGMIQIVQFCENVKMINWNIILLIDSLNYDCLYNLGYYFDGGILMDEENVLIFDWGEYSFVIKLFVFNYDVKFVNFCFVLIFDILKYSMDMKIVIILGFFDIVSE